MLENARKRLRGLVHLIEKRKRKPIYTDFEDEIGDGTEVAFDAFTRPTHSRNSAPRPGTSCASTRTT